ncbi:xylulokinase [Alicyclobacillus fodiniaquatilis]|uniref:Xylulose kinase n=1 Tax=Alicyclobacillus fodiniaquatilis TaxID=1661150 RepID=A0ABW4JEA2_9BACL
MHTRADDDSLIHISWTLAEEFQVSKMRSKAGRQMAGSYLLGIDIGTSGCKMAIFRKDGQAVCQVTEPYDTFSPLAGYVEQDPNDWWRAVCTGIQRMLAEAGIRSSDVACIGVDGQSWSALPVDKRGNALRKAIIWLDTRASQECEQIEQTVGEERIFAIAGNRLAPGYTTGKILWLKAHEPDVYRQTFKFLQSNSFIVYKLTGQFTQDLSQGYGIHAFNVSTGRWDDALCAQMGIDRELLPDIYACSDVVGELTAEAARACGLKAGTPVVAGGLDSACATLGIGAISPGQVQEQGGQSGGMSIVMDEAQRDKNLILGYHVVADTWLLQGGTVGGGSLKWLRRELAKEFSSASDEAFFATVNREAASVPPGSDGVIFLPYMAGERSPLWDIHAKGVFLGLSYDKSRAHMIRAVMEGCAFALQHNLMTAQAAGVAVHELYSTGGAGNSHVWTQMKADITGKIIKVPTMASDKATALGAAMLAGIGVGIYADFQDAVQHTACSHRIHTPDANLRSAYGRQYELYLETYERLKDLFPRLGLDDHA